MSAQSVVNEGSHSYVTCFFWDENGVAVVPTAATYKLDDVSSNQVILVATAFPGLAAAVTLTITPAQNTVLNPKLRFEERRLTVSFTYQAGSKAGTGEYIYALKNLYGV